MGSVLERLAAREQAAAGRIEEIRDRIAVLAAELGEAEQEHPGHHPSSAGSVRTLIAPVRSMPLISILWLGLAEAFLTRRR